MPQPVSQREAASLLANYRQFQQNSQLLAIHGLPRQAFLEYFRAIGGSLGAKTDEETLGILERLAAGAAGLELPQAQVPQNLKEIKQLYENWLASQTPEERVVRAAALTHKISELASGQAQLEEFVKQKQEEKVESALVHAGIAEETARSIAPRAVSELKLPRQVEEQEFKSVVRKLLEEAGLSPNGQVDAIAQELQKEASFQPAAVSGAFEQYPRTTISVPEEKESPKTDDKATVRPSFGQNFWFLYRRQSFGQNFLGMLLRRKAFEPNLEAIQAAIQKLREEGYEKDHPFLRLLEEKSQELARTSDRIREARFLEHERFLSQAPKMSFRGWKIRRVVLNQGRNPQIFRESASTIGRFFKDVSSKAQIGIARRLGLGRFFGKIFTAPFRGFWGFLTNPGKLFSLGRVAGGVSLLGGGLLLPPPLNALSGAGGATLLAPEAVRSGKNLFAPLVSGLRGLSLAGGGAMAAAGISGGTVLALIIGLVVLIYFLNIQDDKLETGAYLPTGGAFIPVSELPPNFEPPIAKGVSGIKDWAWPVDIRTCSEGGNFGKRLFKGKEEFHGGIDVPTLPGTSVYPIASGVVYSVQKSLRSDFGYYVVVKHAEKAENEADLYAIYGHLSTILVKKGDPVFSRTEDREGTILGESGRTGRVTGPHLHLGVSNDCGEPRCFVTAPNPCDYQISCPANCREQ